MDDARFMAKVRLTNLFDRVMADGKIDPAERAELQDFYKRQLFTVEDVREALAGYLKIVQRDVMADGKITDAERARCRAVVAELKIPASLVPPELQAIIDGTSP